MAKENILSHNFQSGNGNGGHLNRSRDNCASESNYKTELCRTWVEKNFCPYQEKCRFAHGKKEIHQKCIPAKNYKIKECNSFNKRGFCPYGHRCLFKHDERKIEDLERTYYSNLLESNFFTLKLIKNLEDDPLDEFQNKNKRLPIFDKISNNSNFYLPQFIQKVFLQIENEIKITPKYVRYQKKDKLINNKTNFVLAKRILL
jgi:hypothetical protein